MTLSDLRSRARSRADMPVAGFIADDATGIDAWINEGIYKCIEILIKSYGEDFFMQETTFSTVAGQSDYDLPNNGNLFQFLGISMNVGGVELELPRFNRTEGPLHKNMSIFGNWNYKPSYRLTLNKIRLLPAPDGVYTCTLRYVGSFGVPLEAPANEVILPMDETCARYVVLYTAIQMLVKEESDPSQLRIELEAVEKDLEELARRRDGNRPARVADVEAADSDGPLNYF